MITISHNRALIGPNTSEVSILGDQEPRRVRDWAQGGDDRHSAVVHPFDDPFLPQHGFDGRHIFAPERNAQMKGGILFGT